MKSNIPRLPWKLQTPAIALKESHKVARWKNLPVLCSVYLSGTWLREALALIYLVSFCVSLRGAPMVSFAAIYTGLIMDVYTGNQCNALCLETLKTQGNK